MTDDSAGGLLAELNEKRRRMRLAPVVGIVGGLGALAAWTKLPPSAAIAIVVLVAIAVVFAIQWDALRKSTVIIYEIEGEVGQRYERLIAACRTLGEASRMWHVESRAAVLERKYHAGALSEIVRRPTSVTNREPPFVKTNVTVPSIAVGSQTLYFFPDRLLVFESAGVGAVPYAGLHIERNPTRFIEEDRVPSDSRVVDRTWRYVNKRGGPDRRFRNNRELPICEYEAVYFSSSSGLSELLHVSRVGASSELVDAVLLVRS